MSDSVQVSGNEMNALQKHQAKAPARPTGKQPSVEEMLQRSKTRWSKTMVRLGE